MKRPSCPPAFIKCLLALSKGVDILIDASARPDPKHLGSGLDIGSQLRLDERFVSVQLR